tara:strand:+ start:461 stop:1717 length:1257 start_codon:yes stop_codon:yes gene_type:complete
MYDRFIASSILEALADTPVILINGARQTGKSTLCEAIIRHKDVSSKYQFHNAFVTLDDPTLLEAAKKDPLGFLYDNGPHIVIDEVQRVPELFLPLKKFIDEDRDNRRVILTGSSNVMMMPNIADSLAGRMEIHSLWPLSQGEIEGEPSAFLEVLQKEGQKFPYIKETRQQTINKIKMGGYPVALTRSERRRNVWYKSYADAVLQKDISQLANIEGLNDLPNILGLISSRVGSTVNMSDISRLSKIKNTTLKRYTTLLEHIFWLVPIPAWTKNVEGRIVKSPKYYINDSGLLYYLMQGYVPDIAENSIFGAVVENFVVMELLKQLSWSFSGLSLYHFSMHSGSEVDIILEDASGGIYAIEVKSSSMVDNSAFKGIRFLSNKVGKKFKRGIVLYLGDQYASFGTNMQAVPISALWGTLEK